MIMLKISIGLFFYRLTVLPYQKRFIVSVITVSSIFGTAFFFFAIFQCGPWKSPDEFLSRFMSEPCQPKGFALGMNYTHAIINALTDIICSFFPIYLISRSQMHWREKIAVIIILIMAILY